MLKKRNTKKKDTMKRILNIWLPAMFLIAVYSCDKSDSEPTYPFDVPEGYELVWNDEFDEGQIDPGKTMKALH